MTTLAAYTGPSPETGYVGYINFSLRGGEVVVTVRPESADGSGTANISIPIEDAKAFLTEARAALEGAEAPQSPIPLELKPIHFRLLERGANSRYIGLSNNSGVRMGEHAALGQLMRAGLVRFTEDSQPPGPRMPTPCEITDAGRAALEGKGG